MSSMGRLNNISVPFVICEALISNQLIALWPINAVDVKTSQLTCGTLLFLNIQFSVANQNAETVSVYSNKS